MVMTLLRTYNEFIIGLIAFKVNMGAEFIKALFNIVHAGAMSALYLLQNKLVVAAAPIQGVRTWLDGVEVVMDLVLAVTAFARYFGRI
jgi:hypothetical protein